MHPAKTAQITVCKSLIVVNIEIFAVSESVSTWSRALFAPANFSLRLEPVIQSKPVKLYRAARIYTRSISSRRKWVAHEMHGS
jgi:hypothetical protein